MPSIASAGEGHRSCPLGNKGIVKVMKGRLAWCPHHAHYVSLNLADRATVNKQNYYNRVSGKVKQGVPFL